MSMRIVGRVCSGAMMGVLLGAVSPSAARADYVFFTAPNSNAANGGTAVYSLNDAANVVGYFIDSGNTTNPSGIQHGFLKSGSNFTTLDYTIMGFHASATAALGINNHGVVVGSFNDGASNHGFTWQGGAFSAPIDYPGTGVTDTYVTAINDAGNLAGYYKDATGEHGFTRIGSVFTTLNSPRAVPNTELWGINATGQVSGFDIDAAGNSAGLIFNGVTGTAYMAPNSNNTQFYQINDAGQVAVTDILNSDPADHAAIFNSTANGWTQLPDIAGATDNLAGGINNLGLAAGNDFTFDTTSGSFIDGVGWTYDTTVPEPASIGLLSAAALLLMRRRTV